MTIYIVWNAAKTVGFVTKEYQLAYEVRKSSDTNCFHEDGTPSRTAQAFCDEFGEQDCTIEELSERRIDSVAGCSVCGKRGSETMICQNGECPL